MAPTLSPPALPDFPWDSLAPYKARASAHPQGLVDLSVGTPVDPTPDVVRDALVAAADAPGYPLTVGTADVRAAICEWFARRRGVTGLQPDAVLPTIGSKELVAWLPTFLGLGAGDLVGIPAVAYPTYDIGARLAGATSVVAQSLTSLGPLTASTTPKLLWLNSPGNPNGQVLGVPHLRKVVEWAREHDVVVASDECYAELDWREGQLGTTTPSILHPEVSGGDHRGLLAVYSLSKQSNLAGYRAAFVAGDPQIIGSVLEVRKHAGMIMPTPVQHAMAVALRDDAHVDAQRAAYGRRRERLLAAVVAAGLRVDHSEAGLYLWATREEDCWTTVSALADLGILVAPGSFYGAAGGQHVRIALTATDERIAAACSRLAPAS
ncbi:succinyldiaminopimelate aminotransferase [Humibacillus xanthopallidus]|uniref:Aminotransferase n=1 Tax=Humibacillus xanthopallidus TaxID=412689 RepID=A0A543PRQ8_9MICO|nr:succinyldiaminopimelate transaminase [Humibacillus xanthopallidus]TQN46763.1 succinyldiaminopimelate aminotransferase [Humibacillus xanthopallidus]